MVNHRKSSFGVIQAREMEGLEQENKTLTIEISAQRLYIGRQKTGAATERLNRPKNHNAYYLLNRVKKDHKNIRPRLR